MNTGSAHFQLVRAVLSLFLFAPPSTLLAADPCSGIQQSQGVSASDTFKVSSTTLSTTDLNAAIGYWSGACGGYGDTFPSMRVGSGTGVPITVIYIDSPSTLASGSCGRTTPTLVLPGSTLQSAEIKIWSKQANGVVCNRVDTLAHELGHLLGLKDAPTSTCQGRIMGERPNNGTRSVSASDCRIADERWRTTSEHSPGERPPRCRDH